MEQVKATTSTPSTADDIDDGGSSTNAIVGVVVVVLLLGLLIVSRKRIWACLNAFVWSRKESESTEPTVTVMHAYVVVFVCKLS